MSVKLFFVSFKADYWPEEFVLDKELQHGVATI
jgi:hypothetical protein